MAYHVMFEDLTNGTGTATPIRCDTVSTIAEARRLVRKLYGGLAPCICPYYYYYVEVADPSALLEDMGT